MIVNVALPSFGTGLYTCVSSLLWVVNGYAIALASLTLPSGTVGDRYGRRHIVEVGLTVCVPNSMNSSRAGRPSTV
ncbi:hypothetical protein [Actinospica sp.]|uniref:hypothetical protein n=1 Tax=Actinospica sp. TaxID=1872142 RepID=UPI002B832C1A|nr:hypothetical protein [Actinospica sp.]HWG27739.1 hypothetical protein [Actinospica sp.]